MVIISLYFSGCWEATFCITFYGKQNTSAIFFHTGHISDQHVVSRATALLKSVSQDPDRWN